VCPSSRVPVLTCSCFSTLIRKAPDARSPLAARNQPASGCAASGGARLVRKPSSLDVVAPRRSLDPRLHPHHPSSPPSTAFRLPRPLGQLAPRLRLGGLAPADSPAARRPCLAADARRLPADSPTRPPPSSTSPSFSFDSFPSFSYAPTPGASARDISSELGRLCHHRIPLRAARRRIVHRTRASRRIASPPFRPRRQPRLSTASPRPRLPTFHCPSASSASLGQRSAALLHLRSLVRAISSSAAPFHLPSFQATITASSAARPPRATLPSPSATDSSTA